LIAILPPLPLGGLTVIDRDFALTHREPREVPPHPGGWPTTMGFWLEGNDKLVIRDCTIYTSAGYGPAHLQMPYGDYAETIFVKDFANLTIINVRMIPKVFITVMGNASLKMINVTNYQYAWESHSSYNPPQPGVHSLFTMGGVRAYDNSKVWVENSRIAAVSRESQGLAGICKESPNAKITVLNTEFIGPKKYTALKVNATISKTEYKWGEPISMTFRLENVGEETLNFFSNGTDGFNIIAHENGAPKENVTLYWYKPTLPEFRLPPELGPGEVVVQTLTLLSDGLTPFSILRGEGPVVVRTNTWWNSSLNPGKYLIEGTFRTRALELATGCGTYLVTISQERWQG